MNRGKKAGSNRSECRNEARNPFFQFCKDDEDSEFKPNFGDVAAPFSRSVQHEISSPSDVDYPERKRFFQEKVMNNSENGREDP